MVQKSTTLEVHVQPGAKRDEVVGLKTGVLYVRVTAPPRRGQANQALLKLVGRVLGVSKGSLEIVRGQTSRNKVIAVQGLSPDDLKSMLAQYPEVR